MNENIKRTIYKNLRNIKEYICHYIYKVKMINYKNNNIVPNIKNFNDTVEEIIYNKKSLCRFGDGEFRIINSGYIGFQESNQELSKRLEDILKSNNNNNCLVGIPNIFTDMNDRTYNFKQFWVKYFVNEMIPYMDNMFNLESIYCDSFISRPYLDYKNKDEAKDKFNKLKEIWDRKDLIIIEGESSRLGVGNDLFNNARSIDRILCPAKDAFKYYNEILCCAKKQSKEKLILISLGPTATVLAYDLSNYGYQAIDIGHIDIEYEWFLKKTKEKVNIPNKFVNEVYGGDIIEEFKDNEYERQISQRIAV